MTIFNDGANDFRDAAKGLAVVSAAAVPTVRKAMAVAAVGFVEDWKRNARAQLSGGRGESHAWGFPDSITWNFALSASSIAVDVGPDNTKKHGFLGRVLETGGEHSPAYLHGLRAMERASFRTEQVIAASMDKVINGATR